jgi:hypothetical protein
MSLRCDWGRFASYAGSAPGWRADSAVPPSLPGTVPRLRTTPRIEKRIAGLEDPIRLALGFEYQGPFEHLTDLASGVSKRWLG